MQRQRQLAVDDEEELLRMQEQFAASASQGDARPAAKATRISRRPAAAGASPSTAAPPAGRQEAAVPPPPQQQQEAQTARQGCAVHGAGCQGHHHHDQGQQQMQQLMAAMQSAMKNIVGEVQERQPTAPVGPPRPPTTAAAAAEAAGAFPEATHRKLSKFALGRQRQRGNDKAAPAAAAPGAILPPAQIPGGLAGPAAQANSEEGQIDAENRQLLAAMTPDQLAAAREEVLQRLKPGAADFLRRRGASKAAAAAAATSSSITDASSGAKAVVQQQDVPADSAGRVSTSSRRPPRPHQQPQPAASQPHASASAAAAAAGGVVARLRFDIDGTVTGLRPAGMAGDVAPADVAERDPLRQDEGVAAEGYTVQEACLLARSSLPQQRVLALRLLAAVLALSRPSAVPGSAGRQVPLPPAVISLLQQEQQQQQAVPAAVAAAAAAAPEWVAVWHHALHAADVVLLLRRSLDDSNTAVAAAAAEALAALLGAAGPAAAAEEAAAEAADASAALTGWPAIPMRHMQRPSPSSAWVAALACRRDNSGHVSGGGGSDSEDEEPLDERQLAKVDPLSGLLHMQLLERAVYLLTRARAAAAVDPLLSILIRLCQAGKDVADQVLATPGMEAALKAVLDAPPPPAAAATGAGAAAGEGASDAAAAAYYAARPKALRLLRQLAAASKAAARQLQESGLVRFALEQLLRPAVTQAGPAVAQPAAPPSRRQRGMLTEALRLWRCFAMHGFFMAALDDAYPTLCNSLLPPAVALAAPVAAGGAAGSAAAAAAAGPEVAEELQQWCVAREAYAAAAELCWHAARSEPHQSMLSPQCAAALAAEALRWLAGLPLHHLLTACSSELAAAGTAPTAVTAAAGAGASAHAQLAGIHAAGPVAGAALASAAFRLSPFPALLAPTLSAPALSAASSSAGVVVSTLAAVVHLVGSYWSVQAWHTAAEKSAAAAQLGQLGLLPNPGSRSSGSGREGSGLPPVLQAVSSMLQQLVASDTTWPMLDGEGSNSGIAHVSVTAAAAELAVALARLAATFLPQRQAAATAAGLLAPLCSQQAAGRFQQAAAAADATLQQPWDAARQQPVLQLARAAAAGLQAAARSSVSTSNDNLDAATQAQPLLSAAAANTALTLLLLLPAGDEAAALQLLALLLDPRQLAATSAAAAAALQAVAGSSAAHLAAVNQGGACSAASTSTSGPPEVPDAQQLSQLLLAGYAAPWLGLVPDNQPHHHHHQQHQQGGQEEAAPAGPKPPASAGVLRPQGSRLPLPADWPLQELPLPPAQAGIEAEAAAAAAGALLLALGWEQQQMSSLAVATAAESKLRAAVMLLFADQQQRQEQQGVVPGGTAATAQEEEEHLWQHPLARWCLAALMQRYCSADTVRAGNSGGSSQGSGCWQQQESRQLAQHFAAVSYGDRLFGAAVALLLRQTVPMDTQLEVLSTLADEQALHLLPPLPLLPGPASAYLKAPTAATCGAEGSASFGAACFGGPSAAPGAGGSTRRQELDLYVKLLTDGPLERCLSVGSSTTSSSSNEGNGGGSSEGNGTCIAHCSVAVPLVLHRLAAACFPDTSTSTAAAAAPVEPTESAAAAAAQQQQALLSSIVQRCASGGTLLLRLLGMLLRWDAAAHQPSDVISAQRLAVIEVACRNANIDPATILQAALEA